MSSILDALRKSALQRERGTRRALVSLEQTRPPEIANPLVRFPIPALLGGVCLIAVVTYLWYAHRPAIEKNSAHSVLTTGVQSSPVVTDASARAETPIPNREAQMAVVKPVRPDKRFPKRSQVLASEAPPERAPVTPVVVLPPGKHPQTDFLTVYEIPEALRKRIEGLTLNVHVFSQDPSQRLALINMQRVTDGDRLAPGVRVQSIVPQGVVLLVQGQRVLLETRH